MWQRIQTLYLGLSLAFAIALIFSRVATITNGDESVDIFFYERTNYLIICVMMLTSTLAALLSFKVRLLQMRVAILSGLIAIGFQCWLGYDYFTHRQEMIFHTAAVFPIVCAILDFLGARGAMLDEAMVQSASRIRDSRRKRNRKN